MSHLLADLGKKLSYFFSSTNSSSIVVIDYIHKDTIIKKEELPIYTAISFISDVGGILGIFLGLSFWSAYDFVALLMQKWTNKKEKEITHPIREHP